MAYPHLKKRDTKPGKNLNFPTGKHRKHDHCSLELSKSKEHSSVSTDELKPKNLGRTLI